MKKLGRNPLLIVISAPSGAGKTTLGDMLLEEFDDITRSVSCTTRPPRRGERDGRDYYFLSAGEFAESLRKGRFLETALVHGHWYGTPRLPVERILKKGRDALLVIDVQGAKMVRSNIAKRMNRRLKTGFVDIFVVPPGMDELRRRLLKRGKDSPETVSTRLSNAESEMKSVCDFRYVLVNDRLKTAYQQLRAIVIAERCKTNPKLQVPSLK